MLSLLVRIRYQAIHVAILILSIFSMIAPAGARPTENPTESATTAELRQTFRLSDRENHCDGKSRIQTVFAMGALLFAGLDLNVGDRQFS